jgi:hypothetical protein
LHYYFPLGLLFYFRYKVFHVVSVGVLLFVEIFYSTPLHSFLQELGAVGSQESKIYIFTKYFSLCLFPFIYIFISCLLGFFFCFLFFFLGFWFVV